MTPTVCCERTPLCALITGDYLEMPGLRLTLAQAQRLWNTDQRTCVCALDSLLAAGFLRKSGNMYIRAGEGRIAA